MYLLVFRLYSCHYASHYKLNIFLQEARMASKLLSKEFGIEDVSFLWHRFWCLYTFSDPPDFYLSGITAYFFGSAGRGHKSIKSLLIVLLHLLLFTVVIVFYCVCFFTTRNQWTNGSDSHAADDPVAEGAGRWRGRQTELQGDHGEDILTWINIMIVE